MRFNGSIGRDDKATKVNYDSTETDNGIVRSFKVEKSGFTISLGQSITIIRHGERNAVFEIKVTKDGDFDVEYTRTMKRGENVTEKSENELALHAKKIGINIEELYFEDHEVNEALAFLDEMFAVAQPHLTEFVKSNGGGIISLAIRSMGAGNKGDVLRYFAGGLVSVIGDGIAYKIATGKKTADNDNANAAASNTGTQATKA